MTSCSWFSSRLPPGPATWSNSNKGESLGQRDSRIVVSHTTRLVYVCLSFPRPSALWISGCILGLSSVKSERSRVCDIDFSRPSPESKSGSGEFTSTTGLGAVLCRNFEKSRFYRPKVRINGPATDRRTSFTRRFRAVRVRHASIRPNLSRPRGVGPK